MRSHSREGFQPLNKQDILNFIHKKQMNSNADARRITLALNFGMSFKKSRQDANPRTEQSRCMLFGLYRQPSHQSRRPKQKPASPIEEKPFFDYLKPLAEGQLMTKLYNKSSFLLSSRFSKDIGTKLPTLKQQQDLQEKPQSLQAMISSTNVQQYPKIIKTKNLPVKDWGLSEEEKLLYGDRVPQNLIKLDLLGKGGFAIVWLCQDKGEFQYKHAVKQIVKSNASSVYQREQRFYQHFFQNKDKTYLDGYQNLIEIKQIENTNKDFWITQELGGKTLSKAMYSLKGEFFKGERVYSITESDMALDFHRAPQLFINLLREILQGINLIHKQGFTHCDLKPENILVDYDQDSKQFNSIKIIDYGSSFTITDEDNLGMVTPEYMSPEVLEIINSWGKYSATFKSQVSALKSVSSVSAVDIWSYGAIILDMLVGIPHWLSYKGKIVRNGRIIVKFGLFANKGRELDKIMSKQVQIIQQLSQIVKENTLFLNQYKQLQLTDLLQKILIINPQERPTPEYLLGHSFFC